MNLINCSDGSALYYLVLELPKKNRSKITNIYLGHRLITDDDNGVEVSDHLYEYRYGKERFSAPLLAKSGIAVLPIKDWYFYRRASVNTGRMYNTVFVIITYSGGKTEHYAYGTMINYVDKLPTKDF